MTAPPVKLDMAPEAIPDVMRRILDAGVFNNRRVVIAGGAVFRLCCPWWEERMDLDADEETLRRIFDVHDIDVFVDAVTIEFLTAPGMPSWSGLEVAYCILNGWGDGKSVQFIQCAGQVSIQAVLHSFDFAHVQFGVCTGDGGAGSYAVFATEAAVAVMTTRHTRQVRLTRVSRLEKAAVYFPGDVHVPVPADPQIKYLQWSTRNPKLVPCTTVAQAVKLLGSNRFGMHTYVEDPLGSGLVIRQLTCDDLAAWCMYAGDCLLDGTFRDREFNTWCTGMIQLRSALRSTDLFETVYVRSLSRLRIKCTPEQLAGFAQVEALIREKLPGYSLFRGKDPSTKVYVEGLTRCPSGGNRDAFAKVLTWGDTFFIDDIHRSVFLCFDDEMVSPSEFREMRKRWDTRRPWVTLCVCRRP